MRYRAVCTSGGQLLAAPLDVQSDVGADAAAAGLDEVPQQLRERCLREGVTAHLEQHGAHAGQRAARQPAQLLDGAPRLLPVVQQVGERLRLEARREQRLRHRVVQVAGEARALRLDRRLLDARPEPRVLDRQCGLVGERARDADAVVVERAAGSRR